MIKMQTHGGERIKDACRRAVDLAVKSDEDVSFNFNDIILTAAPITDPSVLAEEYNTKSSERHEKWINSPEYKQRQAEMEYAQKMKEHSFSEAIKLAPEHMTLKDPEGWKKCCDNNKDAYGGRIVSYAEEWARLMEVEIASGKKLADVAERLSHLVDYDGITGFMYGAAVSILSHCWIHGEELRRWHNINTQIKDEGEKANESGGVLNPAMLVVGT